MSTSVAPVEVSLEALARIARIYGTPAYAYDVERLERQVQRLRSALPPAISVLYSLKANPAVGLCRRMAGWGLGAEVVSIGELKAAIQAGFPAHRILASGPYKSPEMLGFLSRMPETVISVDSVSEWETLSRCGLSNPVILRLRPDFVSSAVMNMGAGSRFGIPFEELEMCRRALDSSALGVVGFHVFAGSQVLDAQAVVRHLHAALQLVSRAADLLQISPEILNLGGGFGVPYAADEPDLDLEPIGQALDDIARRVEPAQIVVELGRYLVAQSGWYLTRVVAHQTCMGRPAVVVDGGIHQRADLCGLSLRTRAVPPIVLDASPEDSLRATDVLGCLCLPDDVLAEARLLPALSLGDVLAFPNAGAYGLSASPLHFLGHPQPAEVAFQESGLELLRERPSPCGEPLQEGVLL
ncbi:MAG TPA: hypothetical protein VMW27_05625 [Thermoanaerobaculia bacterium]|nr:hypothetical protein [Thermoanaerobaculia bacterium]